jgi:hypothetical protein
MKTTTRQDIISRLQASTEAAAEQAYASGQEAGREWASCQAEARQLDRLQQAADGMSDVSWGTGSSAFSAQERFFFAIEPELTGDREEAADFWERVTEGREPMPADYVDGFTAGAVEVWSDVKGEV